MSKILVTTFTDFPNNRLDNFRQAFVNALVDNGNEVHLLLSNKFIQRYHHGNTLRADLDKQRLLDHLKGLGIEAVISMNHSGIFPGLCETLDAPFGLWLLDGPDYLIEADACRERASRYQMFVPVTAFINQLRDEFGYDRANVHLLPFCTDFRAESFDYESNISFIGTYFFPQDFADLVREAASNPTLKGGLVTLLKSFETDPDLVVGDRVRKYGPEEHFDAKFSKAYLLNTVSINNRVKVLDAVADLGLNLYGSPEWVSVVPFSAKLALCYQSRRIYEKRQIEDLYNRSRINLNVSHAQAYDGLPWRVFDIMATRGALVSDNRNGLAKTFGAIELPTYDTPEEARRVTKWLLEDETARKQVVDRSNAAIDQAHRYIHRLKVLQDVLDVPMCGLEARGRLCVLEPEEFMRVASDDGPAPSTDTTEVSTGPLQSIRLQLYYEDSRRFREEQSVQVQIFARPPERISASIALSKAPRYLRLDVGDFFSRHEDMQVWVEQEGADATASIDLLRGLLATHQVILDKRYVTCGTDPSLTFANPFPGSDIRVCFKSRLLASL